MARVRSALALLDSARIDAAVLDVNLGQERSDGIAVRLNAAGTLYSFATGHGPDGMSRSGVEVISKPYRLARLRDALTRALANGSARPR